MKTTTTTMATEEKRREEEWGWTRGASGFKSSFVVQRCAFGEWRCVPPWSQLCCCFFVCIMAVVFIHSPYVTDKSIHLLNGSKWDKRTALQEDQTHTEKHVFTYKKKMWKFTNFRKCCYKCSKNYINRKHFSIKFGLLCQFYYNFNREQNNQSRVNRKIKQARRIRPSNRQTIQTY